MTLRSSPVVLLLTLFVVGCAETRVEYKHHNELAALVEVSERLDEILEVSSDEPLPARAELGGPGQHNWMESRLADDLRALGVPRDPSLGRAAIETNAEELASMLASFPAPLETQPRLSRVPPPTVSDVAYASLLDPAPCLDAYARILWLGVLATRRSSWRHRRPLEAFPQVPARCAARLRTPFDDTVWRRLAEVDVPGPAHGAGFFISDAAQHLGMLQVAGLNRAEIRSHSDALNNGVVRARECLSAEEMDLRGAVRTCDPARWLPRYLESIVPLRLTTAAVLAVVGGCAAASEIMDPVVDRPVGCVEVSQSIHLTISRPTGPLEVASLSPRVPFELELQRSISGAD